MSNESKPIDAPSHQNLAGQEDATQVPEETKTGQPSVQQLIRNAYQPNLEDMNKLQKKHDFWDTQPVPRGDVGEEGPIDKEKKVEDIRKEPLPLLEQFEWAELDMNNDENIEEIYTFLTENYVEDDDGLFRFDYSKEFLKWALTPPAYYKDWIFGVRVKKSKKMVGFITAIPVHVMVNGEKVKMAEVNFLCVHKKLRSNRLAPVLIKEVTRRVNCRNIWQAIYTSGTRIPTPITQARYYHRSLNPKKLIDIKFSCLPPNQTIPRMVKLYKVGDAPKIEGVREFKTKDIEQVTKLLKEYLGKFKVHLNFNQEEVKHWLLPRKDVIYSYVVEKNKEITDFISFYCLPSSVLKHPKYKVFRAAYSYYNIAKTVSFTDLINDALILAAKEDFDVYNALNILDNQEIFKELNFSQGDGNLHYYFYNWRLNQALNPNEMGVVLL